MITREVWPELQKLFGLQHIESATHCCIEIGIDHPTTVTVRMFADASRAGTVLKTFQVIETVKPEVTKSRDA